MNIHSKKILLFMVLLPMYSLGGSKAERKRKLKEAVFEKSKELKELGKQISDASEFITSLGSKYELLREISLYTKTRNSKLSDLEKEQIEAGIEKANNTLCDDLICALCSCDKFDHSLDAELFNQQDFVSPYRFDSLKFWYIRAAAEYHLLIQLVERYDICLHELLEINQELALLI